MRHVETQTQASCPHLAPPPLVSSSFLSCQPRSLVQVLVPHFALEPLQVHEHLAEVLPVKLGESTMKISPFLRHTRTLKQTSTLASPLTISPGTSGSSQG